jgi:hypothetical protein
MSILYHQETLECKIVSPRKLSAVSYLWHLQRGRVCHRKSCLGTQLCSKNHAPLCYHQQVQAPGVLADVSFVKAELSPI